MRLLRWIIVVVLLLAGAGRAVAQAAEDPIWVPGTVDSVWLQNNEYCYTFDDGTNTQTVCTEVPYDANVVVIQDDNGNQYVITIYPEPGSVSGPQNYLTYLGDSLAANDSLMVTFEKSSNQVFGFDKKEHVEWILNYEPIRLSDGTNYFVPWKSIGKGQSDVVQANVDFAGFDENILKFKNKAGTELSKTGNGGTYTVTVPSNAGCVYAWYGNMKLGKLNVVELDTLSRHVVVVPVNGATMNATALQSALNTIYAQANVSWTVSTAAPFSFDLGNDGLESADATLFSKYSPEMRALRDSFRTQDTAYDKNAYYLFIVPNFSDPAQLGYMVRGRAVGFLSQSATPREAAHELGHGAFGLEHTFPKPTEGTTTNLMDYSTGTQLLKKQWDAIHSKMPVFNWMDEEEDGSFAGDNYVVAPDFTIYNINNSKTVYLDYSTSIVTGTLPGFIVYDDNLEKKYVWRDGRYENLDDPTDTYPILVETNPTENKKVFLFYNLSKSCGSKHYVKVAYGERIRDVLNRTNDNEIAQGILDIIADSAINSHVLPCLRDDASTTWTDYPSNIDCASADIEALLNTKLQAISQINQNTLPEIAREILESNYETCLFELLPIEKRLQILNVFLNPLIDMFGFADDCHWQFNKTDFFLDDLILSTPAEDRVRLLNEGFKANNYKWIASLWKETAPAIWNNDVRLADVTDMYFYLSMWVMEYYDALSIAPSAQSVMIDDEGSFSYPTGAEPILIGIDLDPHKWYVYNNSNGTWSETALFASSVSFDETKGKFIFDQTQTNSFSRRNPNDNSVFEYDNSSYRIIRELEPFEPVTIWVGSNYERLGLSESFENTKIVVPSLLAALYIKELENDYIEKRFRIIGDAAAITAALFTAVPSGGSSLAMFAASMTYFGAAVATVDIAVQEYKSQLISSGQFSQYSEEFQNWDELYGTVMIMDAGANISLLLRNVFVARLWPRFVEKVAEISDETVKNVFKGFVQRVRNGFSVADVSFENLLITLKASSPQKLTRWGLTSANEFDEIATLLMKNMPSEEFSILNGLNDLIESGGSFDNIMQTLRETGKYAQFGDGSKFVLRYVTGRGKSRFLGRVIKFEAPYIENNVRYIDILDITDVDESLHIMYEFKSVATVPPGKFNIQFIKDIENAQNLDEIKWIFDASKNPANFELKLKAAIDDLVIPQSIYSKYGFTTSNLLKAEIKSKFNEIFQLVTP